MDFNKDYFLISQAPGKQLGAREDLWCPHSPANHRSFDPSPLHRTLSQYKDRLFIFIWFRGHDKMVSGPSYLYKGKTSYIIDNDMASRVWCCQSHGMGHGQHLNLKWIWNGWMVILHQALRHLSQDCVAGIPKLRDWSFNLRIALWFGRWLDSSAADAPVKFQSDSKFELHRLET